MTEYSVLIGGKAGDGISQAGQLIGSLFSSLGYHVCLYVDYPSLIRGDIISVSSVQQKNP